MIVDIAAFAGPIVGILLTSGVVAALVTFFQNQWLEARRARESERTRLRQSFAEAYAAYADYKEFPYVIRRRRNDKRAEERARISAELNAIESRLSYYRVWTQFESLAVGRAYAILLTAMRDTAGGAMHEAWRESPSLNDAQMNISFKQVDLRRLSMEEDAYIEAVTDRLDELTPRRLRRR